jgi:hypothetical protein
MKAMRIDPLAIGLAPMIGLTMVAKNMLAAISITIMQNPLALFWSEPNKEYFIIWQNL